MINANHEHIELCMPHDCGSKKISIASIRISDDLTPPVRRMLMIYPAMLRDAECLSAEAVQMAAMQAPVVVYEKTDDNGKKLYQCIGNLRTYFLAKTLGESFLLRSIIIKTPSKTHADYIALNLLLSEKSCFLINPESSTSFLLNIYHLLSSRQNPIKLTTISSSFKMKKSFLEAFGINRRNK